MAEERPAGRASAERGPEYGSDLVVQALRDLGYRYLPLNPGSSFRGLHDSIVNFGGNERPQMLLCLHEEIAVSMAHAYAKASGHPAGAAVHNLVGLMHASMAVYNAACDQVPLLLLGGSGPVDPTKRRPIDWIHTASTQAEVVRDYVKWDAEALVPEDFRAAVNRAHAIAHTGPPGPTYVSLDAGAQEERLAGPIPASAPAATTVPALTPDPVALDGVVDALLAADRVAVVAGRLARDPRVTQPLVEIVELLGAAYVDERNAVCFPTNHPQNLNGEREALGDADVVLAVGVGDLPGTLPPRSTGATQAVIEMSYGDLGLRSWSQERGHRLVSDMLLVADPVPGLLALLEALRAKGADGTFAERRTEVVQRCDTRREQLKQTRSASWESVPIAPARMVAELWDAVRGTDWLLLLRNTRNWPEDVWQFNGAGDFLGHSVGAGVGYGPGALVGGALAARDMGRLGVGIVGDGDFLMAAGALWTAVHYKIPMLVIINDNSSFYNDEVHQAEVAAHRGRPVENSWIGMRMTQPTVDLAALARSYGCWATGPILDPNDLGDALRTATDRARAGGVAVVQVRTDPTLK